MKKFSLISISLFIFIIGVGIAAAADMNATVDDTPVNLQNHQCGTDEIDISSSDVIEIDSDINVDASIANSSDSTPVIDNSKDSTVAVETQSKEPLKNNPTIINHSDVIHTNIDPGIKKCFHLKRTLQNTIISLRKII